MDPQTFANEGKAWIEAVGQVTQCAIGQIGTIGLAAIALIQNLSLKAKIKRQGERIDAVMLASSPTQPPTTDQPKT